MRKQYKWVKSTPQQEKKYIEEYLNGKSTSFSPLYHKYKAIFYTMARKWYPNLVHDDLEDMSLEFLGKISQKLDKYDPSKAQVSTWITQCMRNFLIEWGRRKINRKRHNHTLTGLLLKGVNGEYDMYLESDDDPFEDISYRSILKRIYEILGTEDTRIFELHFLQGYSQEKVGEMMNLTRGTMWYRIKKIRTQLAELNPNK